jgi:WD40 repeat protein
LKKRNGFATKKQKETILANKKTAEEKRIFEEEMKRKTEQETIQAKERAEEEMRRKAEQEVILEKERVADLILRNYVTLYGHSSAVASIVQLSDGRLVSGSSPGGTIKIWNLQNGTCERS